MIPNKEAKGRVTDDSLMPARFTETFQRRRISQPDDAVLTTGEDTRTVGTEGCSPGRWAKRFADPLATHQLPQPQVAIWYGYGFHHETRAIWTKVDDAVHDLA